MAFQAYFETATLFSNKNGRDKLVFQASAKYVVVLKFQTFSHATAIFRGG